MEFRSWISHMHFAVSCITSFNSNSPYGKVLPIKKKTIKHKFSSSLVTEYVKFVSKFCRIQTVGCSFTHYSKLTFQAKSPFKIIFSFLSRLQDKCFCKWITASFVASECYLMEHIHIHIHRKLKHFC